MARRAAQRCQAREFVAVGIEDGRSAGSQERGEQPVFRGSIPGHVAVIVEMIAGQVGVSGRCHGQTVEPALVETMARCFDRCPIDPLSGKCGQNMVERDRIGRRQATRTPTIGGDQPERAEARGCKAEPRPDLACEMDDRGLAVGAGHGGDRPRLSAMEPGGETSQSTMRICIGEDYDALARRWRERERRGVVSQDRDGAAGHRIGGEGAAILSRAGQRGEEKAWANSSRVGAEADNLWIEAGSGGRGAVSSVSFNPLALQAVDHQRTLHIGRGFVDRLHAENGRNALDDAAGRRGYGPTRCGIAVALLVGVRFVDHRQNEVFRIVDREDPDKAR